MHKIFLKITINFDLVEVKNKLRAFLKINII